MGSYRLTSSIICTVQHAQAGELHHSDAGKPEITIVPDGIPVVLSSISSSPLRGHTSLKTLNRDLEKPWLRFDDELFPNFKLTWVELTWVE